MTASPDPIIAAQLAEALARHGSSAELAKQAAIAAFSSAKQGAAVAIARWWLAERWQAVRAEPAPVKVSDIEEARAQALCSPLPVGTPIPAMLAEVTGRNIGRLVIVSSTTLSGVREGVRVRTVAENAAWRVLFGWGLAVLVLVHLPGLVDWLAFRGPEDPSDEALRTAAAAVVAIAGATTAVIVRSAYRRLGRQEPSYLDWLTGGLPAVGGILAFTLYP